MAESSIATTASTARKREEMHALYRAGGREHQRALQSVDSDATCPHVGGEERMQAIDFRLEDHGQAVHAPLVRAWWDDTGFAGRCPRCGGWIHFMIRAKRAITRPRRRPDFPSCPTISTQKRRIL